MKWIVVVFAFHFSTLAFGQEITKEFIDSFGKKCVPEVGDYYLVGKKNKNSFFCDTLKSYYALSHHVRSIELRDQFGNRMGVCESFYENGDLKARTRHDRNFGKGVDDRKDSIQYTILEFYDSLGHAQVKNGEGFVSGMLDFMKEHGKVVNGLRDSVWTTYYHNGKVYAYESWQAGQLIDGVSYDESGNEYYYKQLQVLPIPALGIQEFNKQTSLKMVYPKEAQRRGIQGKVMLEVMVEKDGAISSPNVVRGLGFGCDEEALKALSFSAPWMPGKLRGQPIDYKMVVPIIFKLN